MRRALKIAGLVALAALVAGAVYAGRFFIVRSQAWRRDQRGLIELIARHHPSHVKIAEEDLAALTDEQALMRLVRAVAQLHDGHTTLFPFQPGTGFHLLPLQLYAFSDGLYVTAAFDQRLIGKRVVAVGGRPIEEAWRITAPYVAADNEQTVKDRIQHYLLCPEILRAIGVGEPVLTFSDGSEARPAAISLVRYFFWQHRKHPPNYSFRWLDRRTLYVAFNQIRDQGDETFVKFGLRLLGLKPERLVIDVRDNDGGDNTIFGPFLDALAASDLNDPARLYLLIGRRTFSAAVNFTTAIERRTRATLVGEPTGAGPSHFGDTQRYRLPESGLFVFVSSRRHVWGDPGDRRTEHAPRVRIDTTYEDFATHRDRALEWILQH